MISLRVNAHLTQIDIHWNQLMITGANQITSMGHRGAVISYFMFMGNEFR